MTSPMRLQYIGLLRLRASEILSRVTSRFTKQTIKKSKPAAQRKPRFRKQAFHQHLDSRHSTFHQAQKMDSLPDELLVRICDGLSGGDLVNFSRTSRRFSRVARTALYAHCDIIPHDLSRQFRNIRLILDTVVTSPEIGSLIHSIRVPGTIVEKPSRVLREELDSLCVTRLRSIEDNVSAWKALPYEYRRAFGIDVQEGDQDAMIAALLTFLPNLKSLTFGKGYTTLGRHWYDEPGWIPESLFALVIRITELSTTPPLARHALFKHLSSVALEECRKDGYVEDGWNFGVISVFLRLPSMKKFSATCFRDMEDQEVWSCDEGTSNVTDLALFDNRASPQSIRKVLRSCKALENFTCERLCRKCGSKYDCSWTDVHLDLFRHRKSLRRLQLNTKACGHSKYEIFDPVQSFAGLEVLGYLEIDEDTLWGIHKIEDRPLTKLLPPHLKRLIMLGEMFNWAEAWDQYEAMVMSDGHQCIAAVEVWRTNMDWMEDRKDMVGVSWKEIADPKTGEFRHLSEDAYIVGSVLLYPSEQTGDCE